MGAGVVQPHAQPAVLLAARVDERSLHVEGKTNYGTCKGCLHMLNALQHRSTQQGRLRGMVGDIVLPTQSGTPAVR